jgi:hypothetical protein
LGSRVSPTEKLREEFFAKSQRDKEAAHKLQLEYLAAAFHTIMDSTSLAHVDSKGWPVRAITIIDGPSSTIFDGMFSVGREVPVPLL